MKPAIKISIKVDTGRKEIDLEKYLQSCNQSIKDEKRKLTKAMQFIHAKGLMKEFKSKK